MKNIIFYLLTILSLKAMSITPPNQHILDQYVSIALQVDVQTLIGKKGKFSCNFASIHDSSISIFGKNLEEASTRLQLVCIKNQCQKISKEEKESMEKIQNMPENDLRDYLEFIGYSADEIQKKVVQIKTASPNLSGPFTCENGSASIRMTVFDSCFAVPLECREN